MRLRAVDAWALVLAALAGALATAVVVATARMSRRLEARLRRVSFALASAGPQAPSPMADGNAATQTSPSAGSQLGLEAAVSLVDRLVNDRLAVSAHQLMVISRLSDALSAVAEGVVVCDEEGVIRHRNDAGSAFAGARHGEALAELAVTEMLRNALRGGPAQQQLELYGPPRRTLLITARRLGEEQALGAVAIIEDVSERRRLDDVRRDFVANVSHELKTPVGALGILAETMQAEDDPGVARRLAERMNFEAFRVARIIDDLLDLSRIESEEAPVREPVAVHLLVAQAVERIRSVADHRGVILEVSEPSRRWTVMGDRRQLVSALHNLLENAVKYSEDHAVVQVKAQSVADWGRPDGAWIEITVRDHGIGIPSRDLERIFERFYRVDRARARDTGGTGLGLAIVRHVANNHRGEVRVDSREGEGSTFTLRLPSGPGPIAVSSAEVG
jgi:two-component system sensor histidine kinase SenX3